MSKDEVQMRIENVDQKINRVEKIVKSNENKVSLVEVRYYEIIFLL